MSSALTSPFIRRHLPSQKPEADPRAPVPLPPQPTLSAPAPDAPTLGPRHPPPTPLLPDAAQLGPPSSQQPRPWRPCRVLGPAPPPQAPPRLPSGPFHPPDGCFSASSSPPRVRPNTPPRTPPVAPPKLSCKPLSSPVFFLLLEEGFYLRKRPWVQILTPLYLTGCTGHAPWAPSPASSKCCPRDLVSAGTRGPPRNSGQ